MHRNLPATSRIHIHCITPRSPHHRVTIATVTSVVYLPACTGAYTLLAPGSCAGGAYGCMGKIARIFRLLLPPCSPLSHLSHISFCAPSAGPSPQRMLRQGVRVHAREQRESWKPYSVIQWPQVNFDSAVSAPPLLFPIHPPSTPSPSQRAGSYHYFCNSSGRARSGVCSPMPCVVSRST